MSRPATRPAAPAKVATRGRVEPSARRGHPGRIVVVGAGDCGTRAALALRSDGFEGDLSLVGAEADAPYERPPLSKAVVATDRGAPPAVATPRQLDELAIVWIGGSSAKGIDRASGEVILGDGRRLGYDRLLLATGARARRPAIPGGEHVVATLRTLADVVGLRGRLERGTRLLVIGGGFIGLEVAASAVGRGCRVTVLEFAHRLMSRVVPAEIATAVHERHQVAGVDLRCGVGVEAIEPHRNAHAVRLTDGTRIVADVLMAGVGAVPNTELAAGAGLTVANGIAVDASLRTDDPSIFAAGDCCSFPHPLYGGHRMRIEAWRNALVHAEVAAANLLGGDAVADAVPWFWSDQFDLGVQIAGLHAFAATDVARPRDDGAELHFGLDRDGRIVAASGLAVGATNGAAGGSGIGRDIALASQLIEHRAVVRPATLANPATSLRQLYNAVR